jgi:hypothetical protein
VEQWFGLSLFKHWHQIQGRGIEPGVSCCSTDGTSWRSLNHVHGGFVQNEQNEKTKIFSLLLDCCQNLHSIRYWRFWQESYAKFFGIKDLNSKLLRFWYPHYRKLYKSLKFTMTFCSGSRDILNKEVISVDFNTSVENGLCIITTQFFLSHLFQLDSSPRQRGGWDWLKSMLNSAQNKRYLTKT